MLLRILCATSLLAVATAAFAQSDPIAARRAEMKAMGQHIYGSLNRMQRGQEPFDKAKAAFGIKNLAAELNEDDMRKLYRSLRAKAHPDSLGGSHDQFLKIDAAWVVICKRMVWQPK